MTDSELLMNAAKAAGWTWWQSKHGYWNVTEPGEESRACCIDWQRFDAATGEELPKPTPADAFMECDFNPLEDDGDALRLAVKVGIFIDPDGDELHEQVRAGCAGVEITLPAGVDISQRLAAARRAIVRAAAEIGKDMK